MPLGREPVVGELRGVDPLDDDLAGRRRPELAAGAGAARSADAALARRSVHRAARPVAGSAAARLVTHRRGVVAGTIGLWSGIGRAIGAGVIRRRNTVVIGAKVRSVGPRPFARRVMVSRSPPAEPAEGTVIAEFDYAHPVFDLRAGDAQSRLREIQGRRGLYFCGAWTGYGFHEDGLRSALAVAERLGIASPWAREPLQAAHA